jgi:hypothetical protein
VAAFTVTRTAVTTATCRLQASRISIELLPRVPINLSSFTNELAHGYTSAQATFTVKRADPSKHKHVVGCVLAHLQLTRAWVIVKFSILAEQSPEVWQNMHSFKRPTSNHWLIHPHGTIPNRIDSNWNYRLRQAAYTTSQISTNSCHMQFWGQEQYQS